MLLDELTRELQDLESVLMEADKNIKFAPEGRLRISHSSKWPIYYCRKKDGSEEYIGKDNTVLAQNIAQRCYAEKMKKLLEPRKKLICSLINELNTKDKCRVYQGYNEARKKLVNPYYISDEVYAKNWISEPYEQSKDHEENLIFKTANGEKVRSKSEVIIADFLLRKGIPYKYEYPLYYNSHECFHPDFTVLNVRRRKQIYIEHFGLMDSEGYRDSFFWKLKIFNKLGIEQGDNLIMLFEDKVHQFDIGDYEDMLINVLTK
ncbi:hypothetical protein [Butyrivibrio proteoclasticus]|uniref:hypothetical protein n=1 Tax=Butyrivibrio proteoclasticus TaxID=43305 RepID=UPI00047871C9|nr:hypothetical protein [Butyrivibrio proteoclasticus]